jgi:hypothetical protein
LDLGRIWRDQYITDATAEAIAEISRVVNKIVTQPSGGTHVGEWTKKEACWARIAGADWTASAAFAAELVQEVEDASNGGGPNGHRTTASDPEDLARLMGVEPETWFALSVWARETDNLQPWQRGLAYSLGRIAARGGEPSVKQVKQGVVLIDEAMALGFRT